MSYTVADIQYVDRTLLKQWIHQGGRDSLGRRVQVVDVRGHDHIGGHIIGSVNMPSHSFGERMGELEQKLDTDGIDVVVFHCAQSQQRGPAAALKFMRHCDGRFDVKVLSGGFDEWQSHYGKDPALTEGYVPDLWE